MLDENREKTRPAPPNFYTALFRPQHASTGPVTPDPDTPRRPGANEAATHENNTPSLADPADNGIAYGRLIDTLRNHGSTVTDRGETAQAQCPAHDDGRPSLSVRRIEGQVLLHCFAGCATADIMAALHLQMRDLFDTPKGAQYRYDDGRTVYRSPDKRFYQNNVTTIPELYRRSKIEAAVNAERTIYLVEGEKDVHSLEALGVVATTGPMGAAGIRQTDLTPLHGGIVTVVADRDTAGRTWAGTVHHRLDGMCQSLAFVEAADGKDSSDHIAAGHGVEDFVKLNLNDVPAPEPGTGTLEDDDDAGQFALDVTAEAHRLRVRETARQVIAREKAPPADPFDAGLLAEILDRPPEPPYRVQDIIPSDGGLLLVAQRKTGKTTFALNLARALINGEDFLGSFEVKPITGKVAFLNFEVSAATFATWAHEARIPHDRLFVVNLRGRRNPFGHPDDRATLAELLKAQDVETVFVDPFGRAYDGDSQNDAGEVGGWLSRLDEFTRAEVGARDLIVAAHAGWNGERTRGSSALEDWADAVITLTRGQDDDDSARYMSAIGRDVELDEDQLNFDPATRTLTLTGAGSRKAGKDARAIQTARIKIFEYVKANPDCSGNDIQQSVEGRNAVITAARRQLVDAGELAEGTRAGRGGGKTYSTTRTSPNLSQPLPGDLHNLSPLPIGGEVVHGKFAAEPLPDSAPHSGPSKPSRDPCGECGDPLDGPALMHRCEDLHYLPKASLR